MVLRLIIPIAPVVSMMREVDLQLARVVLERDDVLEVVERGIAWGLG